MSDQVDMEKLVSLVYDRSKEPTDVKNINAFPPSKHLFLLLIIVFAVSFDTSLFDQPSTWIPWLLTFAVLRIASVSFLVAFRSLAPNSLLRLHFGKIYPYSEDKSEPVRLLLFPLKAMKVKNKGANLVVLYKMHRELFKKEKLLE